MTESVNQESVATPKEPEPSSKSGPIFRRKRTPLCTLFTLPFIAACLGVIILFAFYHWPRVTPAVFYITVRPAWIWFSTLSPFIIFGAIGLRKRWVAAGILLWAIGLCTCDDICQIIRPFSGQARNHFSAAQMGFWSFTEQGGVPDSIPLRVVSWNVEAGERGASEAIEQLAVLKPDIAFIQEYQWGGKEKVRRAVMANPTLSKYHLGRERGLAILSRFPIEHLPRKELPDFRAALWKVEVLPGQYITCINIHMNPLELRTQFINGISRSMIEKNIAESRDDLNRLSNAIAEYEVDTPVLVAGDFNLPPHYADLRHATANLKDAFKSKGYGWPYTVPANHERIPFPILRVDNIFLPQDAKVFYTAVVPTEFSDHYALLTETRIPLRPSPTTLP